MNYKTVYVSILCGNFGLQFKDEESRRTNEYSSVPMTSTSAREPRQLAVLDQKFCCGNLLACRGFYNIDAIMQVNHSPQPIVNSPYFRQFHDIVLLSTADVH